MLSRCLLNLALKMIKRFNLKNYLIDIACKSLKGRKKLKSTFSRRLTNVTFKFVEYIFLSLGTDKYYVHKEDEGTTF